MKHLTAQSELLSLPTNMSSAVLHGNKTKTVYDQRRVSLSSAALTGEFPRRYEDNSATKHLDERQAALLTSFYSSSRESEPSDSGTENLAPDVDIENYRASDVYAHFIGQLGNSDDSNDIAPDMLVRMRRERDNGLHDNLKLVIRQGGISRFYSANSPLGGKRLEGTQFVKDAICVDLDEGEKGDSVYRKLIAGVRGVEQVAVGNGEIMELRESVASFVRNNPKLAEDANQALENDPLYRIGINDAIDVYQSTPHEKDPIYSHKPTKRPWLEPLLHLLDMSMPVMHNAIKGEPLFGPLPHKKETRLALVDQSKAFHNFINNYENLDNFIIQLDRCLADAEKMEPKCYIAEDPIQLGKKLSEQLKQAMEKGHTLTESGSAYVLEYITKYADIYPNDAPHEAKNQNNYASGSATPKQEANGHDSHSWREWIKSGADALWNKLPKDPLTFPGAEGCNRRGMRDIGGALRPMILPTIISGIMISVPFLGSLIRTRGSVSKTDNADKADTGNTGDEAYATHTIKGDSATTTAAHTPTTTASIANDNLFPRCKVTKDCDMECVLSKIQKASPDDSIETSSQSTTMGDALSTTVEAASTTTKPTSPTTTVEPTSTTTVEPTSTTTVEPTSTTTVEATSTTTVEATSATTTDTSETTEASEVPVSKGYDLDKGRERVKEVKKVGMMLSLLSFHKDTSHQGVGYLKTLLSQKGVVFYTLSEKVLHLDGKLRELEENVKGRIENEANLMLKIEWEVLIKAASSEREYWLRMVDEEKITETNCVDMEVTLFELKDAHKVLKQKYEALVELSEKRKEISVQFNDHWSEGSATDQTFDDFVADGSISDEGSPDFHNMLCDPVTFFDSNVVLPTPKIGLNKNNDSLKLLKLVKANENTFFVTEAASETDANSFTGMWFDGHAKKEGVLSYLDLPKDAPLGAIVFTDVVSYGSIILTDHDDKHLRLYHDPNFGKVSVQFDHVVSYVTAFDYKQISTDSSVARAIIFKDHEGWKTLLQILNVDDPLPNTRKKRSPFEGTRAWLSKNVNFQLRVHKHDFQPSAQIYDYAGDNIFKATAASIQQGKEIYDIADRKGRAVVINSGPNYHSSILVYDSEQRGPILISSGDEVFNRAPKVRDTAIDVGTQIRNFGIDAKVGSDLSKNKNIIVIDGLDTDEMVKAWGNLNRKKYSKLNNNCAQLVRDIIFSGMQEGDIKGLKKNKPLLMPLNLVELANEIKGRIEGGSSRPNVEETVVKRPASKIFSLRYKLSTISEKGISVLRSSFSSSTKPKGTSVIDSVANKIRAIRKPQLKSRQYFLNIANGLKKGGHSFSSVVGRKFSQMRSGARDAWKKVDKGMAVALGGEALVSMIAQWVELGRRYKLHDSLSEHDQTIHRDDMTLSTGLSFIPLFGGFIQETYDVFCGNAGCLSEDAAEEDNAARIRNINSLFEGCTVNYLTDDLLAAVIDAMVGPTTLQHKTFRTSSGERLNLYIVPTQLLEGFMTSLEEVMPTISQGKMPVFVITKVGDGGNEALVSAGLGSTILKTKTELIYQCIGNIQEEYKVIEQNTLQWIRRVPTAQEVVNRPGMQRHYFEEFRLGWRGGHTENRNYNPEAGWKRAREIVEDARVAAEAYLTAIRDGNDFDRQENEQLATLEYVGNALVEMANPDFKLDDVKVDQNQQKHGTAVSKMIFDSLEVVHDVFNFKTNRKEMLLGLTYNQILALFNTQQSSSKEQPGHDFKADFEANLRCAVKLDECDRQPSFYDETIHVNLLMAAETNLLIPVANIATFQAVSYTVSDFIATWRGYSGFHEAIARAISQHSALPAVSTLGYSVIYEPVVLLSFQGTVEEVDIHKATPAIYYQSSDGNIVSSLDFAKSTKNHFDIPLSVHVMTDDFTVDRVEHLTHPISSFVELRQQSIGYRVSGIDRTGLYSLRSGNEIVATFSVSQLRKTDSTGYNQHRNIERFIPDIPIVKYRFEDGFYKPTAIVNGKASSQFSENEYRELTSKLLTQSFLESPEVADCKKRPLCKEKIYTATSFLSLLPLQKTSYQKALVHFATMMEQRLPDSSIDDMDDLIELFNGAPEEK